MTSNEGGRSIGGVDWMTTCVVGMLVTVARIAAGQPADDLRDARVYRAAVRAIRVPPPTNGQRYAVAVTAHDPSVMWRDAETVRMAPYMHPRQRLRSADPDTLDSFLSAVTTRRPVPSSLATLGPFVLVSADHLVDEGSDTWRAFAVANKLEAGVLRLSPIGFNATRTKALVYVQHSCGTLCGSGWFVLLEQAGHEWKPKSVDIYIEF